MSEQKIEPHKITKPIQLLAVWFVALVFLDSGFLVAASAINSPAWVSPTLVIAAIAFVPVFLIAAFIMQTCFRAQLQDDQYYAKWLENKEKTFRGFLPENLERPAEQAVIDVGLRTFDEYEKRRVSVYQEQKGLFLVHSWRPSRIPGQKADIVIWLHQHRQGPLSDGAVDKVEYHLGPMFFDRVVTKYNQHEAFKFEVAAYGPMLCLARVFVRGESNPIEMQRYIDFEESL